MINLKLESSRGALKSKSKEINDNMDKISIHLIKVVYNRHFKTSQTYKNVHFGAN